MTDDINLHSLYFPLVLQSAGVLAINLLRLHTPIYRRHLVDVLPSTSSLQRDIHVLYLNLQILCIGGSARGGSVIHRIRNFCLSTPPKKRMKRKICLIQRKVVSKVPFRSDNDREMQVFSVKWPE